MKESSNEVSAIPILECNQTRRTFWDTGWIGVDFNAGFDSHGYGTVYISPGRGATAELNTLSENDHVYPMVELRYFTSRARVDFRVKLDHFPFTGVADKFEVWQSVSVPTADRRLMRGLVDGDNMRPQELFTRMAALHAATFRPLTSAYVADMYWEHEEFPGPDINELWRPVNLGFDLVPFEAQDATPNVDSTRPSAIDHLTRMNIT